MDCAEERISGLKVEDLDKVGKEYEKPTGKDQTRNVGHHEKIKPSNYMHREREEFQVSCVDQTFNKMLE